MLVTVADPALHDVAVAVLGVLLAAMALPRGVRTRTFTFAFEKDLNVFASVEETTMETATFLAFCLFPSHA